MSRWQERTETWVRSAEGRLDALLERVRRHRILGEFYEAFDGTFGDFARDHGPMYAGAIAFYALLSLIPLVVLLASVLGFSLAGNPAETASALADVLVQVKKVIPYLGDDFEKNLASIIQYRQRLGVVGIVALLLSASQVFRAIEFAMARIFARLDHQGPSDKRTQPRSYILSKLWFGAFITALVLVIVIVRIAFGVMRHLLDVLALPEGAARLLADPLSGGTPVGAVVTGVAMVVGFVILLEVFAPKEVEARFAVIGGAMFVGFFNVAHRVYDFYLERITNIGAMYGSFGAIMIICLWIYFSATLLLFCCCVTKTVQRRAREGRRYPAATGTTLPPTA